MRVKYKKKENEVLCSCWSLKFITTVNLDCNLNFLYRDAPDTIWSVISSAGEWFQKNLSGRNLILGNARTLTSPNHSGRTRDITSDVSYAIVGWSWNERFTSKCGRSFVQLIYILQMRCEVSWAFATLCIVPQTALYFIVLWIWSFYHLVSLLGHSKRHLQCNLFTDDWPKMNTTGYTWKRIPCLIFWRTWWQVQSHK